MPADPDFFEVTKDIFWHALRQIDQTMVFVDINMAVGFTVQPGFVDNRADDVAGFDPMVTANLYTIAFHLGFGFAVRTLSVPAGFIA